MEDFGLEKDFSNKTYLKICFTIKLSTIRLGLEEILQ